MAFVRDLIKEAQDAKVKEQLAFVLAAAKAKAQAFENELNMMFLNPESQSKIQIVGDRAFLYVKQYRANSSTGADKAITETIDFFFEGTSPKVKDGFANLIKSGISVLLGSEEAGESEYNSFYIIPENFALVRVDVKVWRYNFSQKGVIETVDDAVAFIFAKSVIDHTTLSVDEMVYFITETIGINDIQAVRELIEQLKDLWNLIDNGIGAAASGRAAVGAATGNSRVIER